MVGRWPVGNMTEYEGPDQWTCLYGSTQVTWLGSTGSSPAIMYQSWHRKTHPKVNWFYYWPQWLNPPSNLQGSRQSWGCLRDCVSLKKIHKNSSKKVHLGTANEPYIRVKRNHLRLKINLVEQKKIPFCLTLKKLVLLDGNRKQLTTPSLGAVTTELN